MTKTSGLNSKTVTENLFSDTNLFALFIRIMHRQSKRFIDNTTDRKTVPKTDGEKTQTKWHWHWCDDNFNLLNLMFVEISYKVKYKSGQGHCIIWSDGDNDIVSSEANICSCRHSWHVTLRHDSCHVTHLNPSPSQYGKICQQRKLSSRWIQLP